MSSKGSKTNTATKKETVVENVVVLEKKNVKKELVQTGADVPVVATKEEPKTQKGGKKVMAATVAVVEAAPVPVAAAKEETKAQKGGKKAVVVEAAAPVPVPQVVAKEEPKAQKGGKKAVVVEAAAPAPAPVAVVAAKEEPKAQKGGKKAVAVVEAAAPAPVAAKELKAPKAKKSKTEKVDAAPVEVQAQADAGVGAGVGADDVEEEVLGSKLRYFKLLYNDIIQGRYSGKKPKQAANKAFSSIIKTFKEGNEQNGGVNLDINFTIKECTRNSKHKDYKYIGKRQALDNPVRVEIANADGTVKQIEYKFFNKLQKAPKV